MTMEQRMDQLEKRNKRLTVGLTMIAVVAITIQFSACGDNPAGPSLTTCDLHEIRTTPLEERDLTSCTNLEGANLAYANLKGAILENAHLSSANLVGANLEDAWLAGAILEGAILEGAINVPELSAKQEEDACRSDCG